MCKGLATVITRKKLWDAMGTNTWTGSFFLQHCWIRRLLDYGMPLTILMYGDCTSYIGLIRENVGL